MKIGFVNFTPANYTVDTPYQQPLGGSESAMCYLAEELAKKNHQIFLFNQSASKIISRGVHHLPNSYLKSTPPLDLDFLVIQNTPFFGIELKPFLHPKTKLIFWTGHASDQSAISYLKDPKYVNVFDHIVFVSQWQKDDYLKNFYINPLKTSILQNSIAPAFENLSIKKSKPITLAYTSTPFRGLKLLILAFSKIKDSNPDVQLNIYSSLQVYQASPEKEKPYEYLYQLCRQTEGINYFGSIPQPQLAIELSKVSILAYPNIFPETSCIAVMEAMASGCHIVTTDLAALPETTAGFANLIPLGNSQEEYLQNFINKINSSLKNFHQNQFQQNLKNQVDFVNKNYTWKFRSAQWERLFNYLLHEDQSIKIDNLINQGNSCFTQKQYETAVNYYQQVLKINPRQAVALNNLGTVFSFLNQLDLALKHFKKATKIAPNFVDPFKNLGFFFLHQKQFTKALFYFEKTLKLKPDLLDVLQGRALALQGLDKSDPGIKRTIKSIIKLKPKDPKNLLDLGNLSSKLGLIKESIFFYKSAIKIKPDFTECYANLSLVYNMIGEKKKTLQCFHKVAKLDPTSPWAYHNMALVYLHSFQYQKAIFYLKKTLKVCPDFPNALANLFLAYRSACLWSKAEKIEKLLDSQSNEDPFINVLRTEDQQKNFLTAQNFIKNITQDIPQNNFTYPINISKKIRIGYVSRDFRNHPIGHLIASMFKYHHRDKFEIYVYSYGENDKSIWRRKAEKGADKFTDISLMGYEESARIIHQDQIDILIDLVGTTHGSRLQIFAYRPSPIQISYLGFPGTTGANFFDYILVDKLVVKDSDQKYFSEKIIYLPYCYQVNDGTLKLSSQKYQRSDFGLPEDAFVFSSFNQNFKLDRQMFKIWLNILKKVPNSVLWLWHQGDESTHNLKKFAKSHHINPNRLIFSPRLPKSEHIKRLSLTDLALDTRIYGGHTTTSDCLYNSVPVITFYGQHFASRVASSILTTYGLPELITYSLKDYQNLVISLATNPQKFKQLTQKVKKLRKNNLLFDTQKFVTNLENIYSGLWQEYQFKLIHK